MKIKKVLVIFMAVIMLLSMVPTMAFAQDDALNYLVYEIKDDGVTITGHKGEPVDLVIPSEIEGKPVTSIDVRAFAGCSSLKSITIPDSVLSIGDEAFWECYSLESIIIPDSVTSVGYRAFALCESLQSAVFGDSVTSINEITFEACDSLKRVVIGKSVENIHSGAFSWCGSLSEIIVDPNNEYFCSENGIVFNKSKTELTRYPSGKTNTSYTIPDTVTSIAPNAFYFCDNLENIILPDSLINIGEYAFYGTKYYNNEENWENGVLYKGDCLIKANMDISGDYIIKNGTKTIAKEAFFECSSLQGITIPDSVTNIGARAFGHCSNLSRIKMPKAAINIGAYVFYNTIYYNNESNWENGALYMGDYLIKVNSDISGDYSIKNGTKTIASQAFESCENLLSITIPDTVIIIDKAAFVFCSNLSSITIPDSVTSIDDGIFYLCDSLESIIIPDSVTSIGEYAFEECSALQNITIPSSVINISNYAFLDCSSLTTVTYIGTEEQWNEISIGAYGNDALASATINFAPICAHNNTTVLAAVPATCTEMGLTDGKKCADCGEIIVKQESTPIVDHSFGEWTTTKEATETDNGEMTRKCLTCDKTESQIIFKLAYKNEVFADDLVGIKYSDKSFDGEPILNITREFDSNSINILRSEKGDYISLIFDINIMVNDEKVQPNDKVLVGIILPEEFNKDNTVAVFIGENGTEELKSYYADGMIWFETDHFSSYALIDKSCVKGDINGDGKVTATDARLVLRIATKLENIEDYPNALFIADTNRDDKITAVDARNILRVATKLDKFDSSSIAGMVSFK